MTLFTKQHIKRNLMFYSIAGIVALVLILIVWSLYANAHEIGKQRKWLADNHCVMIEASIYDIYTYQCGEARIRSEIPSWY